MKAANDITALEIAHYENKEECAVLLESYMNAQSLDHLPHEIKELTLRNINMALGGN